MFAVAKKKSKKSTKEQAAPLAVIETTAAAKAPAQYITVGLADIVIDDAPNRLHAPTAESVEELARSMAQVGLKQPIGVTLFGTSPQYRLVWGRRRVEAARLLKWESISAVIVEAKTDQDVLILRGIENMQRLDPTPIDEALIVAHVLDVYEAQAALGPTAEPPEGEQPNLPVPIAHQVEARKIAVKRAAEWLGKSEQWVRDRMYLARFGTKERELIASGRLPLGHAREIAKLADPQARASLAAEAASSPPGSTAYRAREYPMEMDELRRLVSGSLLSLTQVPWRLDRPFDGAPACVECPHNSANNPGLFDSGARFAPSLDAAKTKYGDRGSTEPKAGVCTNRDCYAHKYAVAKRSVRTTAGRVNRAIKAMPAKERPKRIFGSTPEDVGVSVPDFIDRSDVVEMAQELQAKSKSPSTGSAASSAAAVDRAAQQRSDQKRAAERKLDDAHRARLKKLEPLLAKALQLNPGMWSMYKILREHPLIRKLEAHNAKPETIMAGAEFKRLIAYFVNPSWGNLQQIEKGCGRNFGLFDDWLDGPSGFADAICTACGIDVVREVGARPKLEDFLPKEKSKAAAPKVKRHVDEDDLDAIDEDGE